MSIKNRQGFWLVLEGLDGTGKTTQLEQIVKALEASNTDYVRVRSPGQTEFGAKIRELLLSPNTNQLLSIDDEIMLMLADRMMLLQDVIKPALAAGKIVLQDRYIPSTYLYQGFIKAQKVRTWPQFDSFTDQSHYYQTKIEFLHNKLNIDQPDLYVYLAVEPGQYGHLIERIESRPDTMTHHDHFIVEHTAQCSDFYNQFFSEGLSRHPVANRIGEADVLFVEALQSLSDVQSSIEKFLMVNAKFMKALHDPRNIKVKNLPPDNTYGLQA